MKISCLIVDDEPMALNLMEGYIVKTPFLQLKAKCDSAQAALTCLEEEHVDLLFLDIQMPELTGLELSKLIPKDSRVIFTTAYDQYAIEGFKVQALDYLLKPFDYIEFLAAANRAKEWFKVVNEAKTEHKSKTKEFLFVRSEHKQLKIRLNNILYFEGLGDYIKIWIQGNDKPVLSLMNLKALEEELDSNLFMRVHRSYIIALQAIDVVERGQIIIGKKRITVSNQYQEAFQTYISSNSVD